MVNGTSTSSITVMVPASSETLAEPSAMLPLALVVSSSSDGLGSIHSTSSAVSSNDQGSSTYSTGSTFSHSTWKTSTSSSRITTITETSTMISLQHTTSRSPTIASQTTTRSRVSTKSRDSKTTTSSYGYFKHRFCRPERLKTDTAPHCRVAIPTINLHYWKTGTAAGNNTYPRTMVLSQFNDFTM